MDIETAKFLFQILQFLLTGGIGIYVYLTAKNRVTNERISVLENDLDTKLDSHGERIASLEASAKGAPTHNDLSAIHEKINKVGGDVREMAGALRGVNDNLQLLLKRITERGLP